MTTASSDPGGTGSRSGESKGLPAAAQCTTTCPVFTVTATCQDPSSGTSGNLTVAFSTDRISSPADITGSCAEPLSCEAQGAIQTQACPSGGGNLMSMLLNGQFINGVCPVAGSAVAAFGVLVTAKCALVGTPGKANCHGKSVAALSQQYGNLDAAAAALGYSDVQDLQDAIRTYCED